MAYHFCLVITVCLFCSMPCLYTVQVSDFGDEPQVVIGCLTF